MDLSSLMGGGSSGPAGDDGLTDNSETITISSLALLKVRLALSSRSQVFEWKC